MTVQVVFTGAADGDDGPFGVGQTSNWASLVGWAESLPADEFDAVRCLVQVGEWTGTDRLAEQFAAAIDHHPPPGSAKHAATLLLRVMGVGDPDETASITTAD